jgi:hypothetical protein
LNCGWWIAYNVPRYGHELRHVKKGATASRRSADVALGIVLILSLASGHEWF